ncbi:MAG: cyclophilin-like fold protein [Eubacteriales bacterium]|nr:cyclophilin-like fold protein [Eubacteriales bacterium]
MKETLPETEGSLVTDMESEVSEEETAETTGSGEVLVEEENQESAEDTEMKLYFDETEIPVIWENCTAVDELKEETGNGDIVVSMSMYGDWEQVGSLGRSYTRSDHQMTAVSGDIVLYSGNQIVVFYGSNSWSYTKLGRMDLPQEKLEDLLSKGDITLTIRK